MFWGRSAFVGAIAAVVFAAAPSAAVAVDPSDAITLSSATTPTGAPIYADYPFSFNGTGTTDGPDQVGGGYTEYAVFTPAPSPVFGSGCPRDFNVASEDIEMRYGGPDALAALISDPGSDNISLDGTAGPFAFAAAVNDDVVTTVDTPGAYVACAYLIDDVGSFSSTDDTFAVSQPFDFTVNEPPRTAAPGEFGGPPGKTSTPSNLGLKIAVRHPPITAPGNDLLEISGRYDATMDAGVGLIVTVKPTAQYNGCAPNGEQDKQITESGSGGAVLADYQPVSPSSTGTFSSPVALHFKRKSTKSYVLCAYLGQVATSDEILVGYERFTPKKPKPPAHKQHKKTKKKKK
jgi:hypothetical protein